jgi:polysaccharide biosynthesis/export protein
MTSGDAKIASNDQGFAEFAGGRMGDRSGGRTGSKEVGVIMRQSVKIRDLMVMVLLLCLFIPAGNRRAWSQSMPEPAAQAQEPTAAAAVSPASASPAAELQKTPTVPVIGAGDLLKVSVLGAPESDQEVRVDAKGNIFLNFIGAVPVAGKTTEEAQSEIAKKYVAGGFYTNPQVSVFAKEYVTQGVSILGEVQRPGVYPVLGARSLFDVLSLAGGTTQRAGKLISITHRQTPQSPTTVSLSNDSAESIRSNVAIYPGDTIVVSKAGMVYVSGDVHRPSAVAMDNSSMTVLQAIAVAEGVNPTANLNNARLIRTTSNGRQEIPLRLKDMLTSKSPDIHLQAEDIIFVPNSAAKSATRRTLDAIIQTATGLAIYGAR